LLHGLRNTNPILFIIKYEIVDDKISLSEEAELYRNFRYKLYHNKFIIANEFNEFKKTFGVNYRLAWNRKAWLGMTEKQFLKYPEFFDYSPFLGGYCKTTTTSSGKIRVFYKAGNQSLTFTNGILTKIVE